MIFFVQSVSVDEIMHSNLHNTWQKGICSQKETKGIRRIGEEKVRFQPFFSDSFIDLTTF